MTLTKEAEDSKLNEIDKLRAKNHALEEEKLRLQLEINQLQRNRRNSPTIKDEPLSPKARTPRHQQTRVHSFSFLKIYKFLV